jgi:hypothetical protein
MTVIQQPDSILIIFLGGKGVASSPHPQKQFQLIPPHTDSFARSGEFGRKIGRISHLQIKYLMKNLLVETI